MDKIKNKSFHRFVVNGKMLQIVSSFPEFIIPDIVLNQIKKNKRDIKRFKTKKKIRFGKTVYYKTFDDRSTG